MGEENILYDDYESNEEEVNMLSIPKLAYIHGLFPGSIQEELQGLTIVEASMINIYSAISNVRQILQNGTCYTIINDLTCVAKQLPRSSKLRKRKKKSSERNCHTGQVIYHCVTCSFFHFIEFASHYL